MKKTTHTLGFTAFVAAGLVLASCSKEQSSYSIDDISGRATITGHLTYTEGQSFEGNRFTELIKDAAERTVMVEVNNSDLDPEGTAAGVTTFKTVTDSEGRFSIRIPVPPQGVQYTVRAEDFAGQVSLLETVENNVPRFASAEGIHKVAVATGSILPSQIACYDKRYVFNQREEDTDFSQYAPLEITVGTGRYGRYDGQNTGYYFAAQQGINAVVSVKYGNELKRSYGATTDSNGKVTVMMPVEELPCTLSEITVQTLPFAENNFVDATGKVYQGMFTQFENGQYDTPLELGTMSWGISGMANKARTKMIFRGTGNTPFDNSRLWDNAIWTNN